MIGDRTEWTEEIANWTSASDYAVPFRHIYNGKLSRHLFRFPLDSIYLRNGVQNWLIEKINKFITSR